MRVLIYVGPAPSRDTVLKVSAELIAKLATAVTLVTGSERTDLLDDAAARLAIPEHIPLTLSALDGNAQQAILLAAQEQPFDLVIVGRLNQPLGRWLPRPRSKVIARRLQPSVLRIHGQARPIRRILLASGGDYHTFADVSVTIRLAAPLGASVNLLHVISQQSLIFDGIPPQPITVDQFLASNTPEARTLRDAALLLHNRGVPAKLVGRSGLVLDEIMNEIRSGDYDLLVVGAHHANSAFDRILLEDITGELLDMSPLPVLVARSDVPEPVTRPG